MEAPAFPVPIGVIRNIDAPVLDVAMHEQIAQVTAKKGKGDLKALIYGGDTWEVV
jgi:2-oxoglutarate ferredoxin oxidoreductase subunit beta